MRQTSFFALIIIFTLFSSFKKEKIQGDNLRLLREMLNDTANLRRSKLSFDGFYNTDDTAICYKGSMKYGIRSIDMYYLSHFFGFYKNGLCFASMGTFKDKAEANSLCVYNRYTEEQNKLFSEWGAYRLYNDTIEILCYRQFNKSGDRPHPYLTHYRGIVKNRDTITDFKMVPPYPPVRAKFNNNFSDIKPHLLIFKHETCKKYIDSDAVWLNKYRINDNE
jgi:hypothetical protein